MDVAETRFPEVKLITPKRHGDARGNFAEIYNKRDFAKVGVTVEFVQDNHSFSAPRGTVRGLHFQLPPYAQDKLVRVVCGSIFDVAVDMRRDSPTFGQYASAILTAREGMQMFVPVGFAHGFCTLEPDTEVTYKVSNYYAPDHDAGVLWNDPDLGIAWPIAEEDAVLSEKDKVQPRFAELAERLPLSWLAAG